MKKFWNEKSKNRCYHLKYDFIALLISISKRIRFIRWALVSFVDNSIENILSFYHWIYFEGKLEAKSSTCSILRSIIGTFGLTLFSFLFFFSKKKKFCSWQNSRIYATTWKIWQQNETKQKLPIQCIQNIFICWNFFLVSVSVSDQYEFRLVIHPLYESRSKYIR